MKKRLISLIVVVVMIFSMLCPAAYADDETVSFDTCTHEWETPLRSGYSITIPGSDVSFSVKTEQCKKCKWYKHVATIFIAEFTYYSPLNVDANGLVPTELATYWANVWYNNFGKNASAQIIDASNGGANIPAAGGRNPKGYGDEGKADVNASGVGCIWVEPFGISNAGEGFSRRAPSSCITGSSPSGTSFPFSDGYIRCTYYFKAPFTGLYYVGSFGNPFDVGTASLFFGGKWNLFGNPRTFDSVYYRSISLNKGDECYYTYHIVTNVNASGAPFRSYLNKIPIFVDPLADSSITTTNNITINNNTWNGNIYTDNSTNLTYIYPQYTTINEKNETVTNISNTPIIYNNETKQYYTYDQTTKNYYYITYNAPSPSPTPAPTEKPGGSISTPETGKPGGDAGDTTGILAVLVEIRDNMIQGFLDIKAAFVAGFAELSANFTLAIENLNVNIQNTFNKKFPDLPEPTPEPALPAPVEPSTGDKWSDDIVSGTSISGTVNAKAGDYVLATVSARSALTIPDSMTYLYKGNVFASNDANQSMSFAYQKIAEDGTYTYTFKQATAGRMYLSLIVLSDIDGLSYSGKYHIEVQSKTPVSVPEKSNGDMLVWGCSSSLWLNSDTSNSKSWITNPDDLTYIGGASNSGQSRQANFIDLGIGAVSRTFLPYEDSGGDSVFVVDAVEIIPKAITPSPSPSPSPSPAPDPGKPDSGDKTNNFWTIIFPNGGGTEDGKKGIFWALVSLILALIAFFANLAVGVGYLFPFLPDGVVMTINTCLIVIFLFTIIKFIMRSK